MMKIRKNIFALIATCAALLSLTALTSCNTKQSTIDPNGEGSISISKIVVDATVSTAKSQTTATSATLDDINLRIENTKAEILRSWDNLADVPDVIKVVSGSYKMVAWSGDASLLPSFEHLYYEGVHKFAITAGELVEVPLIVKIGVTQIAVTFDKTSFDYSYSDYSVDVKTASSDNKDTTYLNYDAQTTEIGKFLPGELRFRLRLTSKSDGKEYVFYPSPIKNLKAAEMRTVNLRINVTSGSNKLTITTNDGYEHEEDLNLNLPGTVLPKPAPRITPNFFESGDVITLNQGEVAGHEYGAEILVPGGIKSIIIRTTNQRIAQEWGANYIDIVSATPEQRQALETTGFRWDEELNDPKKAALNYRRNSITFFDAFATLAVEGADPHTDYPFEIELHDMFNQTNYSSLTLAGKCTFTLRVQSAN